MYVTAAESPAIRELDINRAVDQPTWQDSVYSQYKSSYASDGNFDPNLGVSCAMQNNAAKDWWAVDLSVSYQIDRVTLTNAVSSRKYTMIYCIIIQHKHIEMTASLYIYAETNTSFYFSNSS